MRLLFFFILLQSFASELYGQAFLNGNFEINTAYGCQIDINNQGFGNLMSNVKGIGELQTLDILHADSCAIFGPSQNGKYYVTLENTYDSTKSTAFSLRLADTLLTGMPYNFCFYDRAFDFTFGPVGPIEIGLSDNDSTFGSLIYTTPFADTVWTQRVVNFNAPLTGYFITARYKISPDYTGVFIDNFGTCVSNGIMDGFPNKNIYRVFPNPVSDELNIEFTMVIPEPDYLRIINTFGQVVLMSPFKNKIYVSSLPAGLYLLEIENGDKPSYTKFLKQ